MAKPAYPIRIDLDKVKKDTAARDAAAKASVDERRYRKFMGSDADIVARGNRSQAVEAKEERGVGISRNAKGGKIMKKANKFGAAMKNKSADAKGRAMLAKGGKCYAKGGSIDGIAKKGKTKATRVKMAGGGMTGLGQAAAMSGRTMPSTGAGATGLGQAAAMSGRTFKKGGKPKGK